MGNLFNLILSSLLGITSIINPFTGNTTVLPAPKQLNQPYNYCVDESVLNTGIDPVNVKVPKVLSNIKKPGVNNTTPGYIIPECQNKGNCDGPDTADYVLVATNVKLDHTVFPNSFVDSEKLSDRQIVRQTDFSSDPMLKDRYKNRIYRTHCGDWCYTCKPADIKCLDGSCLKVECDTREPPAVLPYMGSFHCDFIYHLQDTNDRNQDQIDPTGNLPDNLKNPSDREVPADGSVFSVYFRRGAKFPKDVMCETKNQPPEITPSFIKTTNNEKFEFPPRSSRYYRLLRNPNSDDGSYTARNTMLNGFNKIGETDNPLNIPGIFAVYRNLVDPVSDNYIYLSPPGEPESAEAGLTQKPLNVIPVKYYLLERWELFDGAQNSLKLGSFPLQADWVKKWVQESKPAIYIYPEKETDVTIKLNPLGYLTVSDPPYDPEKGWNVRIKPDGQITDNIHHSTFNNINTSTSYSYLYYEAQLSESPDPKSGIILGITNFESRITELLKVTGLNDKEIADFVEYWTPRLKSTGKHYFLVYFLSPEEIERIEPVQISIPIETSIRVRTYFKPLYKPIGIPVQTLLPFRDLRKGNAIVEWGGILDAD